MTRYIHPVKTTISQQLRFLAILICPALLALGSLSTAFCQTEPQPVAVLVGNEKYQEAPLLHCASDIPALAAQLEKSGFRVITHTNTSLNGLRRAVLDLERETSQGSLALFYFAGYAFQVEEENFLNSIGPVPQSAGDIATQSLSLQEVFAALRRSGARAAVVIIDAARPHPLRSRLGLTPGLAHVSAPENTFVAFSTKPGAEMPGRHDHAYTKVLTEHLNNQEGTVPQLLGRVKLKVRQRTGNLQEPWDANTLVESVHLHPQQDTDGHSTRFLAPASAHARALPHIQNAEPRPVFALASASGDALTRAQAELVRPEGTDLDLPLRGSGSLWEKVFQTRKGRVNLREGGTIYSHPSRQSQPLSQLPAGTNLHIVGYVRTQEGIFWLPLTRYQEYMQGGDAAWIFISGTESVQDFSPNLLVSSSVPDVPVPSADAEEPLATTVPNSPGFVYSPFVHDQSYVDVRGYTPGDRVRCPYTGLVFRVP